MTRVVWGAITFIEVFLLLHHQQRHVTLRLFVVWAPLLVMGTEGVGINNQRLFILEHEGEWTCAKVCKTREG
jgi:hypothetical protein